MEPIAKSRYANTSLIHLQFRPAWNKEIFYWSSFSTLLEDIQLGISKETSNNWNWIGHINFWCDKSQILQKKKHRSFTCCSYGSLPKVNAAKTVYFVQVSTGSLLNALFSYCGTKVTSQKCMHWEHRSILNSGNVLTFCSLYICTLAV